MTLWKKTLQILQKPFPAEHTTFGIVRNIAIISVFVTLFLNRFQPTNIANLRSGQFAVCLGFGIITFLASGMYEYAVNQIFKTNLHREKFTLWKWILYVIGFILTISITNFIYNNWVFSKAIQWDELIRMIKGTFTVGIFPVIILGGINLLRLERKHQTIADDINQSSSTTTSSSSQFITDAIVYDVSIGNIRYVEAMQNYINMGYVDTEDQFSIKTERATLKQFLNKTDGSTIVKCHRSYLVNRSAITSVSGNAQGLLLRISGCDRLIPVSRSFVNSFRK